MTFDEFEVLLDKMIEEERAMRVTKGKEYAHTESDRLANFKRIAGEVGISPLKVWYVYFKKHVDAIASYVALDGVIFSNESIEGRILDARVYLSLLRGLIEDQREPLVGVHNVFESPPRYTELR
jgi:hypothetical protein